MEQSAIQRRGQRLASFDAVSGLHKFGERCRVGGAGLVVAGRHLKVERADSVRTRLEEVREDGHIGAATSAALDHSPPPGVGGGVGHAAGDLARPRLEFPAPQRQLGQVERYRF